MRFLLAPRTPLWAGLSGVALLCAALPGQGGPLLAFAALPGLALLLLAFQEAGGRPKLRDWGFGVLYVGTFSWSLRHVSFGGFVAVALAGGLYFLLSGIACRRARSSFGLLLRPPLLAAAWAGTEFLRANFPGIPYPHGQVVQDFLFWPGFLGSVRLFGEAGTGFLLALAAAGATVWVSGPRSGGAARSGGLWIAVAALGLAAGRFAPSLPAGGPPLKVALVQPVTPVYPDQDGYADFATGKDSFRWLRRRLRGHEATIRRADLVVFPESGFPLLLREGRSAPGLRGLVRAFAGGRTLLAGAGLRSALPSLRSRTFNAAFLCDGEGRVLGIWKKEILVPLGEQLPGLELLPRAWQDRLLTFLERELHGLVPALLRGSGGAPLPLPGGGKVGALICFENAFPGPFRRLAEEGAGWFCVLSNEAWYRGGGELDQLLAATVLRALETGRPVLRATNDGWTARVGPEGRIEAVLPKGRVGVLLVEVRPRRGRTLAMVLGAAPGLVFLAVLVVLLLMSGFSGRGRVESGRSGPPPVP